MKKRVLAIFVGMCGLMVVAVVFADLKKGYYRPAELGSLRQTALIELSPDSNYQVSAYPVPGADLVPGDGRQEVQTTATPATAPSTSPCSRHYPLRRGKPR